MGIHGTEGIHPTVFGRNLLDWYDKKARILPWRGGSDPYKVWISEMMLQQTRVDTVIPYYNRFITELPTVESLALVPEEKLLKLWQGLGYYNRAMNLQKAARIIMDHFNGYLPSTPQELQTLPGIGPYSAGAIASIAFGVRTCAVDGNVLRVMARMTAERGSIAEPAVRKRMEEILTALLPARRIGDFNQAMMELGALVCLPAGDPKCGECPVQEMCGAFREGLCAVIPEKKKDKDRRIETKTVFIIVSGDFVALRKREDSGLLANLWEFPHVCGDRTEKECRSQVDLWGVEADEILPAGSAVHLFSHLEWHMTGYLILAAKTPDIPGWVWATKEEVARRYPIPAAFNTFMKWCGCSGTGSAYSDISP